MKLLVIGPTLVVAPDEATQEELTPLIDSLLLVDANAQKRGVNELKFEDSPLSHLGWTLEGAETQSIPLTSLPPHMAAFRDPLLSGFFSALAQSPLPGDLATLINFWWEHVLTQPNGRSAAIGLFRPAHTANSPEGPILSLQVIAFPLPHWSWFVRTPSLTAGLSTLNAVLNRSVYQAIAPEIEAKVKPLRDRVHTLDMPTVDGPALAPHITGAPQ